MNTYLMRLLCIASHVGIFVSLVGADKVFGTRDAALLAAGLSYCGLCISMNPPD